MDFSVTSTRLPGDVAVISVSGEIDVYTTPALREQLVDAVNGGAHRLIVDLAQVDFLDSTALGVLVGALKWMRAVDGDLVVVCTADRLLKTFRITGLTKVLPVVPDIPSAQSWRA
ncbi:STAS domain-containing protein [Saccharopolyspora sp. NPDC000359]|uniref:STAS domain-containing protein n=1 Tax=Saccharopolyspora sp. NPDC000359 TaxID=3154251 RepID=UPI00332D376C